MARAPEIVSAVAHEADEAARRDTARDVAVVCSVDLVAAEHELELDALLVHGPPVALEAADDDHKQVRVGQRERIYALRRLALAARRARALGVGHRPLVTQAAQDRGRFGRLDGANARVSAAVHKVAVLGRRLAALLAHGCLHERGRGQAKVLEALGDEEGSVVLLTFLATEEQCVRLVEAFNAQLARRQLLLGHGHNARSDAAGNEVALVERGSGPRVHDARPCAHNDRDHGREQLRGRCEEARRRAEVR